MQKFKSSKSIWKQSANQPIGLQTIMTFGKYKGQRVSEILLNDKQYIKWLIINDINHQYGKGLRNKLLL